MKEFKDNLDEESINEGSVDRFSSSMPSRTFVQKAVQVLSRYSLLIIVGLAAVSITVLHFQGRYLLQALRGTPLPTFWLERITQAPPVPDKTEVYQQALAEEAREAWRKRSQKITKPQWQSSYRTPVAARRQDGVAADTVRREPPAKKRRVRKRRKKLAAASSPTKNDSAVAEKPSFFQPVRVASSLEGSNSTFLSCVVHGDQEVDNRQWMVLRLTVSAKVRGKEVPAGTLIYGLARMSQDRVQVVISRIGTQPVNYRVYDHTYHEGITLDERDDVIGEAAKETAWRQGNQIGRRGSRELPTRIASDLARGLLQRTRRNGRTRAVFLPDGYPLYIATL